MEHKKKATIVKAFWEQTPFATTQEILDRFKERYPYDKLSKPFICKCFPFSKPYGGGQSLRRDQAVLLIERHPECSTPAGWYALSGHSISLQTIWRVYKDLKRTGTLPKPATPKPEPRQMDIEEFTGTPAAQSAPTPAVEQVPEPEPQRIEKKLVMDRGKHYGHPLDNFQDIHAAKAVIAKCEDVAVRHALEMIWLKITRLVETPDHQDSIDDIKGYAETINMIHAERKRRGA